MGEFHFGVEKSLNIATYAHRKPFIWENEIRPGSFGLPKLPIAFFPISSIICPTEVALMQHTWGFYTYIYSGGL
jgi:hypothetical protein